MYIDGVMPTNAYDENMPGSLTHVTSCNKCDGDCDGRMRGGCNHLVGGSLDNTEGGDLNAIARLEGLTAHSCGLCC